MKGLSTVGLWMATAFVCVAATAFVWQGAFFSNTTALADTTPQLIADVGDQIKGAADKVTEGSKKIIRGTEDKVKETAKENAAKVDRADKDGGMAERKAKRDKNRIQKRASEDAARTEKAAEKSMGAVKDTVDNIKDAFSK